MANTTVPQATFRGFLFADLRGYSDYVETRGDLAGVELLTSYRQIVRATLARFDGAEIRTEGDSFYVVFPSASRAVTCATEIIEAAGAHEPSIPVGIGIHAGEAADTGEGPVGSAVNIAARVCALAGAGEVLVTDVVRVLTRTVIDYRFVARGTPRLKGIHEPMQIFRVVPSDATGAAIDRASSYRSRTRSRRLVIGGVVAVVAFAVVATGGLLVALAPPSGPALTPSATPSDMPMSEGEAGLLARMSGLSPGVRATCQAIAQATRPAGSRASVICPLPAGEGASTVRLDDYGDVAPMLAAFSQQSDAHGAPAPDCAVSATGSAEWSVPRIATGHVLCYPSGGDSYIVWTYDSGSGVGILATASRDDVLWHQLYDWWRAFHPLVAY